jgi:recombinational DNA repair ATPase RecF
MPRLHASPPHAHHPAAPVTSPLTDHILRRLTATGADNAPWSLLVLAALEGDASLATYLAGASTPPRPAVPAVPSASEGAVEPPGAFVGAITVAGFRGVGPASTLPLHPGPGLTLVVGRNGSGKSSFAEGLELLLTGDNLRWKGRAKAWGLGWRNLHQAESTTLAADLLVEGRGPLTAARAWPAGAEVSAGASTVKAKGKAEAPLASLGWTQALTTFRPFLSYNELGSMMEDGPATLYDALATVLSLDEFVVVHKRLADARKGLNELVTSAKVLAATLAAEAEAVGATGHEPRAVQLAALLKARAWNLPALQGLADGGADASREVLASLRALAALRGPDVAAVQQAVTRLRTAAKHLDGVRGTDAARSLERARLLEQALAFHATHAEGTTCPVCGTANGLSTDWRAQSTREVAALKAEATAAEEAESAASAALREARGLVRECGVVPPAVAGELAGLQALRESEARWLSARAIEASAALADHLEAHVLELTEAVTRVSADAAAELARREDVWRPLAERLAPWLAQATRAADAKQQVDELKQAEAWWKDATEAIRDERFAPIAERAKAIWQQLRLQSNVDLGAVELEGTSTKRRVTLKVTVDGAPAEALGVMSQGELHSLALSLFLPRATLPDSPFRFICVDDPVQSMDPARVEGLARVLHETAASRQVIVFSHDDRLPEAVRRLGLPARILRVTRRANSVVEVQDARDPVSGHLEDARAVLKTTDLRTDVKARVVPGFCRLALEAACVSVVRTRHLRAGGSHDALDAMLAEHVKLYPLMALALFDDAARQSDVLARLGKLSPRGADVFQACNQGAHESFNGDVEGLVYDTDALTAAVKRLVK